MVTVRQDTARSVLPTAEDLCAAIRGQHMGAHPLIRIAADLGRFYRQASPVATHGAVRCRGAALVSAVDAWAARHLPVPRPGARVHTESLGAVIDRLVGSQVRAWHLLMTVDDVTDPRVHAAWYRLAELVDGSTSSRRRPGPAGGAAAHGRRPRVSGVALPSKDLLLAACRGFPDLVDHPMLSAAAELAVLHQTRERTPHSGLAVIDRQRVVLMERIDTWTVMCMPHPPPSARVHTQTMGQVIDRIAQLTTYTYTVIAGASDQVFHDLVACVEDLAHGYEDLVEERVAGARRLPLTALEL